MKLTPMLEQYFEIKRQVPDAILFYRLGDFYEMFYEDAEKAAPILDLVLTARGKGQEHEAPRTLRSPTRTGAAAARRRSVRLPR